MHIRRAAHGVRVPFGGASEVEFHGHVPSGPLASTRMPKACELSERATSTFAPYLFGTGPTCAGTGEACASEAAGILCMPIDVGAKVADDAPAYDRAAEPVGNDGIEHLVVRRLQSLIIFRPAACTAARRERTAAPPGTTARNPPLHQASGSAGELEHR
jgi:hypothetical protein